MYTIKQLVCSTPGCGREFHPKEEDIPTLERQYDHSILIEQFGGWFAIRSPYFDLWQCPTCHITPELLSYIKDNYELPMGQETDRTPEQPAS